MSKRALDVHSKSKKHILNMKEFDKNSASTLSSFLKRILKYLNENVYAKISLIIKSCSECAGSLDGEMDLNSAVTKAEILWTVNVITKYQSNNSSKHCSALFSVMFPDSEMAKKSLAVQLRLYI